MTVQLTAISTFFFFNDTATTEIYTLSLHDALPILTSPSGRKTGFNVARISTVVPGLGPSSLRSEEHTSELQSQSNLVCRLLLEKKKIAQLPGCSVRMTSVPTNMSLRLDIFLVIVRL